MAQNVLNPYSGRSVVSSGRLGENPLVSANFGLSGADQVKSDKDQGELKRSGGSVQKRAEAVEVSGMGGERHEHEPREQEAGEFEAIPQCESQATCYLNCHCDEPSRDLNGGVIGYEERHRTHGTDRVRTVDKFKHALQQHQQPDADPDNQDSLIGVHARGVCEGLLRMQTGILGVGDRF